jgi:hypothetical protein
MSFKPFLLKEKQCSFPMFTGIVLSSLFDQSHEVTNACEYELLIDLPLPEKIFDKSKY